MQNKKLFIAITVALFIIAVSPVLAAKKAKLTKAVITEISDTTITATKNSKTYTINAERSVLQNAKGKRATIDQIFVGDQIDVNGSYDANGNIVARTIKDRSLKETALTRRNVGAENLKDDAISSLDFISNGVITEDKLQSGTLTNASISDSAGIGYSKLNLANSISGNDLASNISVNTTGNISGSNITASGVIISNGTGDNYFTGNVGIGTTSPNQQLEITKSFRFPATTASDVGVIYKGDDPFIHNYQPSGADGSNTFVGVNSGNFTMSTGGGSSALASYNTALGVETLHSLTTGRYNTSMGYQSLYSNTSSYYNTAVGSGALYTNTTGNFNTAVGGSALVSNSTGNYNAALGGNALQLSTTGSNNSAFGMSALSGNTTGESNAGFGDSALARNQSGSYNTAIGRYAGNGTTNNSYSNNSLFGYKAGYALSTGSNNILLGYQAGDALTTGASNILLGYNIDAPAVDTASYLSIGNLIFATGGFGTGTTVGTGKVGIGTTSPATLMQIGSLSDGTGEATNHGKLLIAGYGDGPEAVNGLELKFSGGSNGYGAKLYTNSTYDYVGIATRSQSATWSERLVIKVTTGNVGIGTTNPAESLDINGQMKLKKNSAEPYACSASHDSAISLTNKYTTCVCKNGTGWVLTSDGTTACTWN